MTLFFPWGEGLKAEQIEHSYDGMQSRGRRFKDWVHAGTGMDVLKAQHPEFELWSQGIHARSGVACADCHMPYKREGALKVTEHWVRSPLLGINRACETCHPNGEKEIRERVEAIQDRHHALLTRAGQAAVAMLDAMEAVRTAHPRGGQLPAWQQAVENDPGLRELGDLQRAAQWRLDFVAAENSMGFHAPQEMARLLAESIDLSRQAQVKAVSLLGSAIPARQPAAPAPASAPASRGP
jgi:nitrite reductase (cytochrome c-552)